MKLIFACLIGLSVSGLLYADEVTDIKKEKRKSVEKEFYYYGPHGGDGCNEYTITRSKDGDIIGVERQMSGCTWSQTLTYSYNDGYLTKIVSEYCGLTGELRKPDGTILGDNEDVEEEDEDALVAIWNTCVEVFKIEGREIKRVSIKCMDSDTGKPVKAGFRYIPLIGHWASVYEIPLTGPHKLLKGVSGWRKRAPEDD